MCLKGMVIPVFGLAEFVQEEYHSLNTQYKDNSSNETSGVEGVVLGR